jgi:hypothetical protein
MEHLLNYLRPLMIWHEDRNIYNIDEIHVYKEYMYVDRDFDSIPLIE